MFLFSVCSNVTIEDIFLHERFITLTTFEWFIRSVYSQLAIEVIFYLSKIYHIYCMEMAPQIHYNSTFLQFLF